MTPADYQRARKQRGTQAEVAKLLAVERETIAKRETRGPITREAWLAITALPVDGATNFALENAALRKELELCKMERDGARTSSAYYMRKAEPAAK